MGVATHQELWEKIKGEYKGFSYEIPVTFEKLTVKKEDKDEEQLTMIASTNDVDRHGDIVQQDFELEFFKANPVLLDSHNYNSITEILGKVVNIRIEDGKLKGELDFALMNPKGVLAREMSHGGYVNASSIGFIPKLFDQEGNIVKSELLEISLVSVPANARALFEKKVKEIEEDTETLKKEIETEEPVETIIETKTVIDTKKELLKSISIAVKELSEEASRDKQKQTLAQISTALKEINNRKLKTGFTDKKRLIFKALRSL